MKKENILRKNWQFQSIIDKKKQIVNKYLVVYFFENNLNKMRIGISISKKFTNAVYRNKYRRQTRAALDLINYFDKKSFDVVLILRKPFLTISHKMKEKVLLKVLEEL